MRRLAVTLAVLAAPALAQTSDPFAPSGGQTDPFAPSGAEQADPFAPSGGQSDPFAPAQDTPEADVEAPSDDTAAPAPAPAVSAGLDAADPQGIMEWVQEQGYRAQMTTDSVGDPMITSGAQGAAFDIMFYGDNVGISREGSLLDMGVDHEFVEKSGAWFSYEGERLGQGRENAKLFLAEHPEVSEPLERRLREELGLRVEDGEGEIADVDAAETNES